MYDFLVVGAGPFGATFAHLAANSGKRVLVVEKRNHLAGNTYTKDIEGIRVHWYGPHIFHTSNDEVWRFVNRFAAFNHYINSPIANVRGKIYNLPFNMNTFYQIWGESDPGKVQEIIASQTIEYQNHEPRNLEEQALKLVGRDIYHLLIENYTAKQWGRNATELPAFIIKRLPLRFTYDNNYFSDKYQGIPIGGYTRMTANMLAGIEVRLGIDFLEQRAYFESIADKIIYTGSVDGFFDNKFGQLEYRTLEFEHALLPMANYQGNAVVNYPDADVPYTRIIEHKHFEFGTQPYTYISRESSHAYNPGRERYYPINDEENNRRYEQYAGYSKLFPKYVFGGRLGDYKYYDMHIVIQKAMDLWQQHEHC